MNEQAIFIAALQVEPIDRKSYLDKACGKDEPLRRRVEKLLAAHERAGSFLNEPAIAGPSRAETATATIGVCSDAPTSAYTTKEEQAGTVVAGRYTLVQVIGEGGMGSVYLAEQTEPVKRQVALKLIKAGMDSKAVLARFDSERQALALMDHPNIARVYDGGTTHTGQPFFVMELVQGIPLSEYCDQKRLQIRARLELFVSVCQAVQHAHQKGIIHRDLKPSNVLVTEVDGRATPKVIDFGVAKATERKLTDMSLMDAGSIVGTPAYMSPEQADPTLMDIDTRTDVYTLGVILYELLAGSPPIDTSQFKRGAILEMLRMVQEVDPPKPSTKVSTTDDLPSIAAKRGVEPTQMKRVLVGDLDWIVMKALEKDRTRRYETVNGFAADILRHLANEPVTAAPPSRAYRMRKFVRRNRVAVITASLVFLALVSGIVGTSLGLLEAKRQERSAEMRRLEAVAAQEAEAKERDRAEKERVHAVQEEQVAKVAESRARHYWYDSDINLAQQAMETSKGPRLLGYLQRQLPQPGQEDLRGFEWYYLNWLSHPNRMSLKGHTHTVTCVAYSPDGKFLAIGSGAPPNYGEPGEVKLWDCANGIFLRTIGTFPHGVSALAFSPDGKILATGTGLSQPPADSPLARLSKKPLLPQVKLWDTDSGTEKLTLPRVTAPVAALVFTPDGETLVVAASSPLGLGKGIEEEEMKRGILNAGVELWDLATSREKPLILKTKGLFLSRALAISADGKTLAAGGVRTAFPAENLKPSVPIAPDLPAANSGALATIIANARSMSGAVHIWDLDSGKEKQQLQCPAIVNGIAFSPGVTALGAACQDNTVRLWELRTGEETANLNGHSDPVTTLAFSPNGKVLASGSQDRSLVLWDLAHLRKQATLFGHSGPVTSLAYARDGRTLASGGSSGEVFEWDTSDLRAPIVLRGEEGGSLGQGLFWPVTFSPDGKLLAMSSGRRILLWNCPRLEKHVVFDEGEKQDRLGFGLTESIESLSFSPDSKTLASKSGNRISLWDVAAGKKQKEYTLQEGIGLGRISFSPDGRYVAAGGMLLELATGKIEPFMTDGTKLRQIAFAPDGQNVAGQVVSKTMSMGTVVLFHEESRRTKFTFEGHERPVQDLAFSRDGQMLVSGSDDAMVRVWNVAKGELQALCSGHQAYILSVDISPDGQTIASASADGSVKLWDPITGQERLTLSHDGRMAAGIAFSPDGQILAVGWGIDKKNPLSPGLVTVYRGPRP